jgi:hypothetical protein
MQKAIGSTKFRFEVNVPKTDEGPKKIFLPKDQAEDLMSKNPEVKNLVKDLGLDTK